MPSKDKRGFLKGLVNSPGPTLVTRKSRPQQKAPVSRCRGFNLLELMIAIAVAATFLGTATPSIREFRANNQVLTAGNSIINGLNLARFSAVTRGTNVLVCPSSDSVSCSHGDWYQGWIVFHENGASNEADGFAPAEADIIRVGIQTGFLKADPGYKLSIVFEADGTTALTGDAQISICYDNSSYVSKYSQISISPFGLIASDSIGTACSS
jgi:prepilin-type N-terminal cleavage/methylation domain-containing protein